jgi:hypothetical protein
MLMPVGSSLFPLSFPLTFVHSSLLLSSLLTPFPPFFFRLLPSLSAQMIAKCLNVCGAPKALPSRPRST